MKKIVSMEVINRAFDDISQIDYITVSSVTDSMVSLNIYLNTITTPKRNDKLNNMFRDRAFVLGNMLDRKINIAFIPNTITGAIKSKFRSWLT